MCGNRPYPARVWHVDGSRMRADWHGDRETGTLKLTEGAPALGPAVVVRLQEAIRAEATRWFVELAPYWHIAPADDGSGIALHVQRGINCEGHDHVVTSHTNTIARECEAFTAAVEKHKETLGKAIDGFCAMASGVAHMTGWPTANVLAAGFMQVTADFLVREAEKIDLELGRPKAA